MGTAWLEYLPNEVRSRARSLHDLGFDEVAFSPADALLAIDILQQYGKVICGGDVWTVDAEGRMALRHEHSWSLTRDETSLPNASAVAADRAREARVTNHRNTKSSSFWCCVELTFFLSRLSIARA
jgi:hypothetical protein